MDIIISNYSKNTKQKTYKTDKYGFITTEAPAIDDVDHNMWCKIIADDIFKYQRYIVKNGVPLYMKYKVWNMIVKEKIIMCGFEIEENNDKSNEKSSENKSNDSQSNDSDIKSKDSDDISKDSLNSKDEDSKDKDFKNNKSLNNKSIKSINLKDDKSMEDFKRIEDKNKKYRSLNEQNIKDKNLKDKNKDEKNIADQNIHIKNKDNKNTQKNLNEQNIADQNIHFKNKDYKNIADQKIKDINLSNNVKSIYSFNNINNLISNLSLNQNFSYSNKNPFFISKLEYDTLKSKISNYEHQIHVDVQRTFRSHFLFHDKYSEGQSKLFSVLVAYANYNPQIGYCQGMSSFVALILMYLPELNTFNTINYIIKYNNLETLFDDKLSKLRQVIEIQNQVLEKTLSKIHAKIKKYSDLSVFIYSWYLTLFSRFDIALSLRIFDLIILYDFSILLVVVICILRCHKTKIMKADGESLIRMLTRIENEKICVDKVMKYFREYEKKVDLNEIRKKLGIVVGMKKDED